MQKFSGYDWESFLAASKEMGKLSMAGSDRAKGLGWLFRKLSSNKGGGRPEPENRAEPVVSAREAKLAEPFKRPIEEPKPPAAATAAPVVGSEMVSTQAARLAESFKRPVEEPKPLAAATAAPVVGSETVSTPAARLAEPFKRPVEEPKPAAAKADRLVPAETALMQEAKLAEAFKRPVEKPKPPAAASGAKQKAHSGPSIDWLVEATLAASVAATAKQGNEEGKAAINEALKVYQALIKARR